MDHGEKCMSLSARQEACVCAVLGFVPDGLLPSARLGERVALDCGERGGLLLAASLPCSGSSVSLLLRDRAKLAAAAAAAALLGDVRVREERGDDTVRKERGDSGERAGEGERGGMGEGQGEGEGEVEVAARSSPPRGGLNMPSQSSSASCALMPCGR
jgi:hypothetical protein